MPKTEWYWDQFDLAQEGGELDIKNDTALQNSGLDRAKRNDFETKFIDELYGTDNAVWGYPDRSYAHLDGTREGVPTYAPGQAQMMSQEGQINLGSYEGDSINALWGLDLRRVLNEDLEVGSTDHYEHLTRGEVDWASYQKDNAFKKAFNTMKKDSDAWDTYGNPNDISFLTDDQYTDQQKVGFIRGVNDNRFGSSEDDELDGWEIPDDFDNKYESKYHHEGPNKGQRVDGQTIQPYQAKSLFDPNSDAIQSRLVGANGQRMTIRRDVAQQSEAGSQRDVQGAARKAGITLKKVNVKRPANIPASWGSVKGGKK